MIDGGVQIAHQFVKMVGGVLSLGLSATLVASNVCRWLTITDDRANPHAQLDDARPCTRSGSVPTTDLYGDPIAVNNAGTILSETEVSAPLWNVDPADWVRTACTIAGRVCTPMRPFR
jgi:hypothetical protein